MSREYVEEKEVKQPAKKVVRRSLLAKYFTPEQMLEIYKITMMEGNNNRKGVILKEYLTKEGIPYEPIGSGTNRYGILLDGYAVKIALDKDGMIDNMREMLYSDALQPYVVKVYELSGRGLMNVTEYVEKFVMKDLTEKRSVMEEILSMICESFLVGDVGISSKNYINWGTKVDGQVCILDFAYIYNVKYGIFSCSCNDSALLRYDKDYNNLICPICGKKYTFGQIRKKVTRRQQEMEIGDIHELGYNIHGEVEEVDFNQKYEPKYTSFKKRKISQYDIMKMEYKKYKKEKQERKQRMIDIINSDADEN